MSREEDPRDPTVWTNWRTHRLAYEQKVRELQKKAPPVRAAIQHFVEERARANFGPNLHIGFDVDMTHIGLDLWYETDEELERDKVSGRRDELADIMRTAARECANAEADVRFHSHQFVREKCGGDYFVYLR